MSEATPRPRPLVLCILDGFGERAAAENNAVRMAKTPTLAEIAAAAHTTIGTSGPDVGLPKGQMGNSEVGHLNFGAGRIAQMDITRIDVDVANNTIGSNPVIAQAIQVARMESTRLHLIGLVSDGGVHSQFSHLGSLIEAADYQNVPVVVHAILDGRDVPPKSAGDFLARLEHHLQGKGVIGSVMGRYWAMDRDQRWDRVVRAFEAIVRGRTEQIDTTFDALAASYARGKYDEFVEPVRIGDYDGVKGSFAADFSTPTPKWDWHGEEVALAFNFRPDRMREIVSLLTLRNVPDEARAMITERGRVTRAFSEGHFFCMTEYDKKLALPVAYPKPEVQESFGELVSKAGMTQLRCAETEKYAHVTYFFNGGREEAFAGEDRKLVPSPRDVPTYDKKPEMSAAEVARQVTDAVKSAKYDFILVNFANPDMVGHTGELGPAIQAVESVDRGLAEILAAVREQGGALIVTSDHGNCEQMKDAKGQPHTSHTTNRVPFYLVDARPGAGATALREGGRICDVAPTMLELLGLPQPEAMTGRSLLVR